MRVPLAMMWPARVKPGRRVDDFVNFSDLAPTILEAARLPIPEEMSGRSVLDVLLSGRAGRVDPARSWTAGGLEWHGEAEPANFAGRMIRDERYLYIVNYSAAPRRPLAPREQWRPDAQYAKTAESADEIELIERHPEHPAVQRFVTLFASARPREELYDAEEDPWQLQNLADSPAHAAVKARLKAQLEDYQRRTKDPRITEEMRVFEETRAFVLKRK